MNRFIIFNMPQKLYNATNSSGIKKTTKKSKQSSTTISKFDTYRICNESGIRLEKNRQKNSDITFYLHPFKNKQKVFKIGK